MTDPTTTPSIDTTATPVAEQTPVEAPPTPPAAKPKARAKSTAPKSSAADAAKQTCAFCGKSAGFEASTSVGGRPPLSYHGCPESQSAIFEYMQATHLDADAPAPVTVAK